MCCDKTLSDQERMTKLGAFINDSYIG